MLATGTCRPGDPDPDWGAMVAPGTTLAVYMGIRAAPRVVAELIAGGAPRTLEVDVVARASTATEVCIGATLDTLADAIAAHRIDCVALILLRWPKDVPAVTSACRCRHDVPLVQGRQRLPVQA